MENYLKSTFYFDYDKDAVQRFTEEATANVNGKEEKVIALYYAVRDGFRYNPYTFRADPQTFTASYVLEKGEAYCIPKAVLLGAGARYLGVPSRLGFADVTNHLSDPKFEEVMKSDVFAMHGYTELFLNDQWVKATPAFNKALCDRYGVQPLEFNGKEDSIFHEFTADGSKYMEYLKDHGVFDDVPHQLIVDGLKAAYPHLADKIDHGEWIER